MAGRLEPLHLEGRFNAAARLQQRPTGKRWFERQRLQRPGRHTLNSLRQPRPGERHRQGDADAVVQASRFMPRRASLQPFEQTPHPDHRMELRGRLAAHCIHQ